MNNWQHVANASGDNSKLSVDMYNPPVRVIIRFLLICHTCRGIYTLDHPKFIYFFTYSWVLQNCTITRVPQAVHVEPYLM